MLSQEQRDHTLKKKLVEAMKMMKLVFAHLFIITEDQLMNILLLI